MINVKFANDQKTLKTPNLPTFLKQADVHPLIVLMKFTGFMPVFNLCNLPNLKLKFSGFQCIK